MENMKRCRWANGDTLLSRYHDEEWGMFQLHDDRKQFEFLTMEVMQCGLSWMTVLKKREDMRRAFDMFDPAIIAGYDEEKINALLTEPGIIHAAGKIRGMVKNAAAFLRIQKEFHSFDEYFWRFTNGHTLIVPSHSAHMPAKTPLSERISKDMKKRGFMYLGPVVMYSHMQAAGMMNDHEEACFGFLKLGGKITDKDE